MTSGQDARLFDLGYRGYEGRRERPARAILTLAEFTARRVLGLGRGGRHKVLPAVTLAIAYLPALLSVAFAVLLEGLAVDDLISYGDYMFIIGTALALFAALIAPEALGPDRRSGMLGLYLAGPLDRTRYVVAKGIAVLGVMLLITLGPLLFMLLAFVLAGFGPSASEIPELLLRILAAGVTTALLYASLALAVSSFTARRAAAAVGIVLLLFVPASVVRPAIESADAPKELDLAQLSLRGVRALVSNLRRGARGRRAGLGAVDVARRRRPRCDGRGRLPDLLAPLPPPGVVPVTTEPRVVAEGVSKWFGPLVAVSDVSFDVGPGVTALLGPNGAGKSTMFRMLCGLARPSKGTVRVLGRDPRTDTGVARQIGLVPQQEGVFEPLTAREFVALSARLQGVPDPAGAATAALEQVELDPAGLAPPPLVLEGDATACQGRPGDRPRPVGARARRAADRPRPAAANGHGRAVPQAREPGALRDRVQPRAR